MARITTAGVTTNEFAQNNGQYGVGSTLVIDEINRAKPQNFDEALKC
jgi:hypothetical protein